MGSLYQQKGRDGKPAGPWWIKLRGRPATPREHETETAEGAEHPQGPRGPRGQGQPILPRADRVRYEEIRGGPARVLPHHGRRNLTEAREAA